MSGAHRLCTGRSKENLLTVGFRLFRRLAVLCEFLGRVNEVSSRQPERNGHLNDKDRQDRCAYG
jgi:hypothetical protein